MSIVQALRKWIDDNQSDLNRAGVSIDYRLPAEQDPAQDKGVVGLIRQDIIVSFTIWDRGIFMTETIIINANSGKTLLSSDENFQSLEGAISALDFVKSSIVHGNYAKLT